MYRSIVFRALYTEISYQFASIANSIILTFLSLAPNISKSWGGGFHFRLFPDLVAISIQ
jgi:hypothetical protein